MLLLIEKSWAARKAPEALGASKRSLFDIAEAVGQSMGVIDGVRLLFLCLMVTVALFVVRTLHNQSEATRL